MENPPLDQDLINGPRGYNIRALWGSFKDLALRLAKSCRLSIW